MMSNDLVKMKLELKVLWKFRAGYKKELHQHLSNGYTVAKESILYTILQNAKCVPTNNQKFHIELDGFIDVDDKAQDKLEKMLMALWNTCKSFKNDGIEIKKVSTPGVKQNEHD